MPSSAFRFSRWFLSFCLPSRALCAPLSSHRCSCSAHLIFFDFITRIVLGEDYRSWSFSLRILLQFPVASSILGPNIILSILLKSKAVPLQAWSGPEGSRKLRFPDFMTTAQDGGKVVSLTHRPPSPPGNVPGTHFC